MVIYGEKKTAICREIDRNLQVYEFKEPSAKFYILLKFRENILEEEKYWIIQGRVQKTTLEYVSMLIPPSDPPPFLLWAPHGIFFLCRIKKKSEFDQLKAGFWF